MTGRLAYPEIECWPAISGVKPDLLSRASFPAPAGVDIDVLEIAADGQSITKFQNEANLFQHFPNTPNPEMPLRIFFIEGLDAPHRRSHDDMDMDMGSWFSTIFGVSPLFFQLFQPEVKFRNDGGTSFPTKDSDGKFVSIVVALDGFYQISSGVGKTPPSYLWFKHALVHDQNVASTYVLYKCPPASKQKIFSLSETKPSTLLRPLSIDALILAERLNHWGNSLLGEHVILRDYITDIENPNFIAGRRNKAVRDLHYLSEHFHVIRSSLEDTRECIDYLVRIYQGYPTLTKPSAQKYQEYGAVGESLAYLLSRTRTMTRWAGSYIDHTENLSNFLFNLLTSSIAISTQQDSSSMITMAAVTMFFLPGTFVSALFSMVFFNANSSNSGLVVNDQLWLFFVITVPLTIAVFLTWELWRRHRQDPPRPSRAPASAELALGEDRTRSRHEGGGVSGISLSQFGIYDDELLRRSPSLASRSSRARSRMTFELSERKR